MVSGSALVDLVNAVVPLYLCIGLGYASSKLQILPHEQTYGGIGGFVSKFSLPFLVFRMIGTNNPYQMDLKLIAADTIFKVAVLFVLCIGCFCRSTSSHQSLAWVSLLFNLATMTNTVLIGTPLLTSLYPGSAKDVSALVFMQGLLWYGVCILLLEIQKAVYTSSKESEVKVDIVTDQWQKISSSVRDREQGEGQQQQPGVADGKIVIHIPQDAGTEPEGLHANYAETGVVKVKSTKSQAAKKIAQTVLLKLLWAPIVWASIVGFTYSLLNFKFNEGKALPAILKSFIDLMADSSLGICMFMVGMNMCVAPKLFAGGIQKTLLGVGLRFIVAPGGMAMISCAVGLRGNMFRVAVLQAMVPQALMSFVLASQYNVHADILSTAVWFQTAIFFPFAIALNLLLGLGA